MDGRRRLERIKVKKEVWARRLRGRVGKAKDTPVAENESHRQYRRASFGERLREARAGCVGA